jgi:CheY-like chemotaxis protein
MDEDKGGDARILLVEDSMIIALDAEETLLQLGAAEVVVQTTVAGALAALAEDSFDLALLDHSLGSETSEAVAEALRARGIPFWLATGYNEMADQLDEIGARGLLVKPYGKDELARIMRGFSPQDQGQGQSQGG